MTKTNHGKMGEALDLLNKGLQPFVELELDAVYKGNWQEFVQQKRRDNHGAVKKANRAMSTGTY